MDEQIVTAANPMHVPDLDINPADEGYIIYQAEQDRVHFLNPMAVFILELCNGRNSEAEIADLVKEAYSLADPPAQMVGEALAKLKDEGLLL